MWDELAQLHTQPRRRTAATPAFGSAQKGLHGFVRGVAAARAIHARETTLSKLVGELGVLGPQHFKLRERVAAFVPHMQRCGMQGKPACMHNRDGPIRGMEQKDGALSSPPIAPAIALAAIIAAEPMPIEILKADV